MATITLRSVKGSPLTNAEVDTNFSNLNNDKVETATYTAADVLTKIKTVDGAASGLDSDLLDGQQGTYYLDYTNFTNLPTLTFTASDGSTNSTITIGSDTLTIAGTSNQITSSMSSDTITLSTPQNIDTAADVQFDSLGLGTASSGTTGELACADIVCTNDIESDSLGIGTSPSGTSGEIRAANSITAYYSDARLKENIQQIPDALNKVMSLQGVTYQPNSIAESFGFQKEDQVGVLAHEVQSVLPEAVKHAPFDTFFIEGNEISRSGQNYMTVQYEKLVPLLIEAIKELNNQVKELKGE